MNSPIPVNQPTGGAVFDLAGEEERVAYLKSLGARNVDPPLPCSTHLKIISSGRVLPYDALLAEQRDLVMNCDAFGNTDPSAWRDTVSPELSIDDSAKRLMLLRAQSIVLGQARQVTGTHQTEQAINLTPRPTEYPADVAPYKAVNAPVPPPPAETQEISYPGDAIPWSDVDNLARMLDS